VALRSIGLGVALMASAAAAGVEPRKDLSEMVATQVTAQCFRMLTGLFAQPAPDLARTATVVIGFRG
jgi:hypothetical protein